MGSHQAGEWYDQCCGCGRPSGAIERIDCGQEGGSGVHKEATARKDDYSRAEAMKVE